jgi:hypothetical protein
MNRNLDWQTAARDYISRVAREELMQFMAAPGNAMRVTRWHRRKLERRGAYPFQVSQYVHALVALLNANDEEAFKATKRVHGYYNALGF